MLCSCMGRLIVSKVLPSVAQFLCFEAQMSFGTDVQTARNPFGDQGGLFRSSYLFQYRRKMRRPISVPMHPKDMKHMHKSRCMVNLTALASASRARVCDLLQGLGVLTGEKFYRQVYHGEDSTVA